MEYSMSHYRILQMNFISSTSVRMLMREKRKGVKEIIIKKINFLTHKLNAQLVCCFRE